jgi:hypothetical protein
LVIVGSHSLMQNVPLPTNWFHSIACWYVLLSPPTGRFVEPAERVSRQVRAVRVELAAGVVRGEVDARLVDAPRDLDVRGRAHELRAGDRPRGHETRAVALLRAVRDDGGLDVPDGFVGDCGAPDAEVRLFVRER